MNFIVNFIYSFLNYILDLDLLLKNLIQKNTNIKLISDQNINSKPGDIIIKNNKFFYKLFVDGEIGLAESYMDGDWDSKDLQLTLTELISNSKKLQDNKLLNLFSVFNIPISKLNNIKNSKQNISHHYDIGNDLYTQMLGEHMQYSCALFNREKLTLDDAQLEKMKLVAKKLDLKKGMVILDIGCGFGKMAHHLAANYGVTVFALTLSQEQKKYIDANLSHENLITILKDYREIKGEFDRIYSIGMFEHVGFSHHKEYFNKCYELLKPDGIMLLHTMGGKKRSNNTFIKKYIFPGADLPLISDLVNPLWHMEDLQNFGLSYEKTLNCWKDNIGNWDKLKNYDTKFRRMWEYYLVAFAASFKKRNIYLLQVVYTKHDSNRIDDCHYIRS